MTNKDLYEDGRRGTGPYPTDPRDPPLITYDDESRPDEPTSIIAVQDALQAMIALYGGERVAKWVRDLTFLIERKELP
jgi:hypothetical protein